MDYEHIWAALVLVWIFGMLGLSLLRRQLERRHALRRREMLHRERLAALEHGQPIPEVLELGDEELPSAAGDPHRARQVALRRLGMVLGAAGAGATIALYLSSDADLHALWSLGLIPIFVGFGLLLAARHDDG